MKLCLCSPVRHFKSDDNGDHDDDGDWRSYDVMPPEGLARVLTDVF